MATMTKHENKKDQLTAGLAVRAHQEDVLPAIEHPLGLRAVDARGLLLLLLVSRGPGGAGWCCSCVG